LGELLDAGFEGVLKSCVGVAGSEVFFAPAGVVADVAADAGAEAKAMETTSTGSATSLLIITFHFLEPGFCR
jgi:hypothetical protein